MIQVPGLQKTGYFQEFEGDILSYPSFRAGFISSCHAVNIPLNSKYLILKNCLKGVAQLSELINTTHPDSNLTAQTAAQRCQSAKGVICGKRHDAQRQCARFALRDCSE